MANNAVLGYLDLICRTKHTTRHSFFEHRQSFVAKSVAETLPSPDRHSSTGLFAEGISISPKPSFSEDLPIHDILLHILEEQKAHHSEFFAPLMLHHWQLVRLLNILRCNTPILTTHSAYRAKLVANTEKIAELTTSITNYTRDDVEALRTEINLLEAANVDLQQKIAQERDEIRNNGQVKETIQAVLVLSTLLNIVFRDGMSVPLFSDQLALEAQQHECLDLLHDCYGIDFDGRFAELWTHTPSVQTEGTVPQRMWAELKYQMDWLWGKQEFLNLGLLDHARQYVARVLGVQDFHLFYNNVRLGGTRFRRLLKFLDPFLQNTTYSAAFKAADPFIGTALAYLNWIFFIPRISLNLSLLYHHLWNDTKLYPLERNLDRLTRFRVHWTRFWFEVFVDFYWIIISLKNCFGVAGGAFSPLGIYLGLLVQALDLICGVMRAGMELYRLYKMSVDLEHLDPNLSFKKDVDQRFRFEVYALGYTIFHFSILTLSMCLFLPAVTSVSTLWPVVGAVCGVLMTVLTFYVNRYYQQNRQAKFEPRPEPQTTSMARCASHFVG